MIDSPGLPAGWRLVALDLVSSTNDEAAKLARAGAGEGTVVTALRQTAGRGRRGRSWQSLDGNLFCSVIVSTLNSPSFPWQVGLVSGLALAESLVGICPGLSPFCKWPNDILCGGRKLAGILVEGDEPWLVVGVGVNLEKAPEADGDMPFPPGSLKAEGFSVGRGEVLGAFARSLHLWLAVWRTEGFAPVREAWLKLAYGFGQVMEVRSGDRSFKGTFRDMDIDGALLLETSDGTMRRIVAGDLLLG